MCATGIKIRNKSNKALETRQDTQTQRRVWLQHVQRKTAAVLCSCECVKRLGFFNTSISKRGTRRHYITRQALTKPSTGSHPHFLENRIHHVCETTKNTASVIYSQICPDGGTVCGCYLGKQRADAHFVHSQNSLCKGEAGSRLQLV